MLMNGTFALAELLRGLRFPVFLAFSLLVAIGLNGWQFKLFGRRRVSFPNRSIDWRITDEVRMRWALPYSFAA